MQPEDLDQELNRLWAKVSSVSGDAPAPPVFNPEGSNAHDITMDAIVLLKRQQRQQQREWAEMMEAKERALLAYKERQLALEGEIDSLRERLKSGEARIISEVFDAQAKLEAGFRSLEEDKERHSEEQRSLQGILEATRERLADETARWKDLERQWQKREQQYLLDLKELQGLASRHQELAGKTQDDFRGLSDDMKEAKNALEKTLAELLRERQIREEAVNERAAALKKVDEVERHFAELSKIWEEERGQWRELWDRERSTWETQRAEIASWEEKLRKEREAWHGDLKTQESSQLQFVAKVNETLRASAETSSKLASTLKILEWVGAGGAAGERKRKNLTKGFLIGAAFCAAAALAVPVWNYFSRPHFKLIFSTPVALENPTALAHDGALVFISEWDGKILSFDPANMEKPVHVKEPAGIAPYHPTALAFGGEYLWSLDSAQARILKHKAVQAEQVLYSRPAPGPAPTALAYDGELVWSYDAANKTFYQHGTDEGRARAFTVEEDVVPTAMAWVSERLWVFDSKSRSLIVYALKGSAFKMLSRQKFSDAVIGLAAVEGDNEGKKSRQLWVLAGPAADRPGNALIKYEY